MRWLPGPESEERGGMERFLVEGAITVWRANGTVKMGSVGDERASVGAGFRA